VRNHGNSSGARLCLGLAATALTVALAPAASQAADPIKIGHVAALSGPSAQSGEAITRGLTIAIDEINAKGGLLDGRQLVLVQRDDESSPPKGVTAARELMSNEKVAAIFGGIDTPVALASVPITNNTAVAPDKKFTVSLSSPVNAGFATLPLHTYTINDEDAHGAIKLNAAAYSVGEAGTTVLLDGTAEIAAGRCGEPVKLNLGDVGYYRVRYDAAMQAALARNLSAMEPADRINLLNDAWALVESLREVPSAYFVIADGLGVDDHRRVIDQLIGTLARVDKLERSRPGRAAFQAYARALLRPIFERVGWQAADGEPGERAPMRARLIRALGDLGDDSVVAEAKRRFEAFLKDPASLPQALRDPVMHLAGRAADRATYETLHGLGRKSKTNEERVLHYSALASSLDPALARETLAIALTDELPNDLARRLLSWVATQGEQPELAVEFVKRHFETLAAKHGSTFRNTFMSSLMANFSDPARAEELKQFAAAYETSSGRTEAERTRERILADAEFVVQQIPAVDEWVRRRGVTP